MSDAGFYRHDPGVCIRAHGDANDVFTRQPAALDKHRNNSVLSVTGAANGDSFTLEINRFFDVGIRH
jgi:hypothetical protein